MNLLIISDLHLGIKDRSDMFGWDELEFIYQIERLTELYSIGKVILNGDIFESQKYSYDEISRAYPVLIKYFRNNKFVLIKGNHDIVNNFGTDHFQIRNSSGQIIHIEHGHNADWFNGTRFGRKIATLGLLVLKKLAGSEKLMQLYNKIVADIEDLNKVPKRYNTIRYLTYALRLLKTYDIVILSHTHKLESHHTYYLHKKKRYLNSGSCSLGRMEGIILNTNTLRYELIKETSESMIHFYHLGIAI